MQICCFLVSVKSRIQQARVSHFPRFFCTRCSSWIAERWAFLTSNRRAARIPKNVPFISSTPHVSAPPLPTLLPIPLTFSSRSGSVAATPDLQPKTQRSSGRASNADQDEISVDETSDEYPLPNTIFGACMIHTHIQTRGHTVSHGCSAAQPISLSADYDCSLRTIQAAPVRRNPARLIYLW